MFKGFTLQQVLRQKNRVPDAYIPFRVSLPSFLDAFAVKLTPEKGDMPSWHTAIRVEHRSVNVPLYIVQEIVDQAPLCHHCKPSGWSHHFMSKMRYHFVIPADAPWNGLFDYQFLNGQNHILHGMIHLSGYGHLLSINGREGGSTVLHGKEVMEIWEHLCATLNARAITVEDVSLKQSMDLRLISGIAYGHPWFGKWDYTFLRGTYGVTSEVYSDAIKELRSVPLDDIIEGQSEDVKNLIHFQQTWSKTKLMTLGELFNYMLTVGSRRPKQKKQAVDDGHKNIAALTECIDPKWKGRVDEGVDAIVKILKTRKGGIGISRTDLSKSASKSAGIDSGFINHILGHIDGLIVDGQYVKRVTNTKRSYDFFLCSVEGSDEGVEEEVSIREVAFLFDMLVTKSTIMKIKSAAEVVLKSKFFVKKWPFNRDREKDTHRCYVEADFKEQPHNVSLHAGEPEEIVSVARGNDCISTLDDLKREGGRAFRDTYCVFENFVVTDIDTLAGDDSLLSASDDDQILLRGTGIDLNTVRRYEGGSRLNKVHCVCGADEEDGESMVECGSCHVKRHARCNRICVSTGDADVFLCKECS